MNINKILENIRRILETKKMAREKSKLLLKYKITEEYLVEIIAEGDKEKRDDLKECRRQIKELENIIKFLKQ